jgi:hypothetical protein|nr:hypothetical protein [uncultured Treponema sp.]
MYAFDNILHLLKNNKRIKIEQPIPACPKHADRECPRFAGHCEVGNNQKCEQRLNILIDDKRFFSLYPKFVMEENTKIGFLKKSDPILALLFHDKIIEKSDTL